MNKWVAKLTKYFPFVIILALGIFLRFFKISQFQFDSDELSAIFRAQHALNWQQHLWNGIAIDGHPAGIQTFIWIWIKLISNNPLPLKIITASLGVVNMVLIFIASKRTSGLKSAYFAMLCFAILWWEVDLSLWVRPYIFGQFFCILIFIILEFHNKEGFQQKYTWIFLSIYTAGAFYTHHFATLTAFLLILYIFLFHPIKRKNLLKSFWLFCLLAIPQISILTAQLKIGGLDWLGKPQSSFFVQHLIYIFNNSTTLLLVVVYFLITGIYFSIKSQNANWKFPLITITLWLIPILIGYFYSIYAKPVLQNNVLFFSMPLLIIALAHFYQNIPKFQFVALLGLITITGIYQIFIVKQRYSIEINDVYASQISILNKEYNKQSKYFLDGPNDVFQYFQSKQNNTVNLESDSNIWLMSKNDWNWAEFRNKLTAAANKKELFLMTSAGSKPEIRPLTYLYFNHSHSNNYIGGQIDFFKIPTKFNESSLNKIPSNNDQFPMLLANETEISPNTNYTYSFSSDYFEKYPFSKNLEIQNSIQPNDFIVIQLNKDSLIKTAQITTAIINHNSSFWQKGTDEKQIDFRYTKCNDMWDAGFGTAIHVVKLSDIPNWNRNSTLRLNIEIPDSKLKTVKIKIYRFIGNPYQYGIN